MTIYYPQGPLDSKKIMYMLELSLWICRRMRVRCDLRSYSDVIEKKHDIDGGLHVAFL